MGNTIRTSLMALVASMRKEVEGAVSAALALRTACGFERNGQRKVWHVVAVHWVSNSVVAAQCARALLVPWLRVSRGDALACMRVLQRRHRLAPRCDMRHAFAV